MDTIENPLGPSVEIAARPGALVSVEQQRAIAEVQARMLIARANPRDAIRCMDLILQDCTRPTLAQAALYQYARGGTDISGPSIRLMETIARRWGNLASGIQEVSRQQGYSECVAYAWDMESNYRDEKQFHVRHWRDTRGGGHPIREEREIYELIANMGQRRKRAALQAVIPGDIVEAAVEQCEATLQTHADTSPEAILKMAAAFASLGVTKEQIEARCQRHLEAIRPAQIINLRKIYASIKDGISEPGDWFAPAAGATESAVNGTAALRERIAERQPPPISPEFARASERLDRDTIAEMKTGQLRERMAARESEKPATEVRPLPISEPERQKRHRRTKAEMAAARAAGLRPTLRNPAAARDAGRLPDEQNPADPQPERSQAGETAPQPIAMPESATHLAPRLAERADYAILPIPLDRSGRSDYRTWFLGLFLPTLRNSKTLAEFKARIADNLGAIEAHKARLTLDDRIAAQNNIDAIAATLGG